MKQSVGVVLIALGMLAAVSAVSMNMRPEAQQADPAFRLGQAVGGAFCTLVLVVPGFMLALSKRKPDGSDR